MEKINIPPGFQDMLSFGFMEALLGRRSRRFFRGAEIPDGVFAYRSRQAPLPLSELEKLLVVTACGGNTGWHHLIYRAQRYAPFLSNYAGAAGGRTFPSSAGFHPSTVPSNFVIMHLQAHHLDLEFYDRFYEPGAYLQTHVDHLRRWHGVE
jgi:hypothetical protein